MDEKLHDGMPELLSIDNMADGAVYEMVGDALKQMAQNIADPNTEAKQTRSITLKITAKPYDDRTGASLSIDVRSTHAGQRPAMATMHIARRNGEYLAFGRNTKQMEIFQPADDLTDAAKKPQ